MEKLIARISKLYADLSARTLAPQDVIDLAPFQDVNPQAIVDLVKKRTITEPDILPFRRFEPWMGTILDLGAHWGYTAVSMRNAGTKCPIVSIEALDAHRPCLSKFREIDGDYDFYIGAISDRVANVVMYNLVAKGQPVTGINSIDGATLIQKHVRIAAEAIHRYFGEVEPNEVVIGAYRSDCRPLDQVFANESFRVPVNKVVAIKLDVEGHEAEVARGACGTLVRCKPLLMVEYGLNNPPLLKEIYDMGYKPAQRVGDQIVPLKTKTDDWNNYFYHPDHFGLYESIGLMVN